MSVMKSERGWSRNATWLGTPFLVPSLLLFLAGSAPLAAAPVAISLAVSASSVQPGTNVGLGSKVTGSTNTSVTWYVDGIQGGNAAVGKLSGGGTATNYLTTGVCGPHTIKVTSVADATQSASAVINVLSPVGVTLTSVANTVQAGAKVGLVSKVTGSTNTAVTWYVDGVQGGNTTIGKLSGGGTATSYIAPAVPGVHTVSVTSAAAPSVTAAVLLTVQAPATAPAAPVVTGPVELQAGSGPYTASVALPPGVAAEWSITGGTLLSPPGAATAMFDAGSGPYVTLNCKVSNTAGSASSSRWMVALPFAPRNHLADLKASLATNCAEIQTEVASGDPAVYYRTSYYLHGLAAAAEATGDTQVMDTLVGYITQMISLAQPLVRNGVTYQAWAPWDVNGNPQQLNTYQAAGPLARTAAIIAGNPAFMVRYSANYKQIVAFVDQLVFKYWFDKQTGVYANPQSSWLGGYIPWLSIPQGGWGLSNDFWNDKTSHVGAISAWMYQATKSPLYLEYATRIATDFRTHVSVVNGGWVWDHGCYPAIYTDNLDGSPDTSHANREPMMVASMYEAGISFQLADLQAMAATLTDLIWNQSQTSPMFTNYIDGGNVAYGTSGPWANGNIYHGWNMLGKYSQKAMLVLALTDQILQQGGYNLNASMPTNGSSYGLIELAGTEALNINR